ncbi:MAG: isoprenyl transferase [Deltaproteobacteria bacterium]|nr:isoprenyl transferase [Deltaproteobacteria bacterium]
MKKTPAPPPPIPTHVAIIMDGNGRWARARGLPRLAGHHEGAKAVRRTVTYAREIGVRYLTLYSFSSENWSRPAPEITGLMNLLHEYLNRELRTMLDNGIRLHTIGAVERLPDFVRRLLDDVREQTADLDDMTLTLALSYGGRDELVRAVRGVAREVAQGKLDLEAVDAAAVERHLDTVGLPDPDLLIRTSGESRISNFLLWQIAYSELCLVPTLWPDFDEQTFHDAIVEFQARERRFGKTSDQVQRVASAGRGP